MPSTKTATTEKDQGTAGLSPEDRETFRQALLTRRKDLLDLYNNDVRSGQESSDESADDFVDRANNSYARELMFSLSDTERELLIQVEEAVDRVGTEAYGDCLNCGRAIGLPRLKAVPWARHCIDCQEQEEMGLLGR